MATRKRKIDFTGVEAYNRPAEGIHKVRIAKVEEATSQGGNEMFKVSFEVIDGPSKGCRAIENYPLIDTALWKLKSLLQAVGMKADGRVQIDLDKLEGKVLDIVVADEEYNGQTRARVKETRRAQAEVEPEEEEDDDDFEEEEVEEKPKKSKKSAKKPAKKPVKKEPEPVEEDDDDDWDDDWDDEA